MNPVAGSLTTTANAARENSIKGPGRGNAILYRFWSHISTVLTLPRYFRSHEFHACIVRRAPTRRATYAPIAIRTWLLIPQSASVQRESPAHRSIDLSSSHTIYSIDFLLSKVFEFQVTKIYKILNWNNEISLSEIYFTLEEFLQFTFILNRLESGGGFEISIYRRDVVASSSRDIRAPTVRGEKSIKIHLVGASFAGPLPTPFFSK